MSNHLKRTYPIALAVLGFALSIAVFSRLPYRMPTHWGLDGNPNGWMPRPIGAFFALRNAIRNFDPKLKPAFDAPMMTTAKKTKVPAPRFRMSGSL